MTAMAPSPVGVDRPGTHSSVPQTMEAYAKRARRRWR